ncbi:MAG: hypothetical protein OEW15_09340 [Nitrospirota bacterium]|nr:hypothetical protein [Nitrospirota bacterium]
MGFDRGDLKELEALWLEKLKPYEERGYHERVPGQTAEVICHETVL